MDETGIQTGMLPKYTYDMKDRSGYCKGTANSVKDTAVVTLSANGSGHLLLVPYLQETKTIDEEKVTMKKRCGVGTKEMIEWCKNFISSYAHSGDLLLLDNLASHKDEIVKRILKSNNINIEYGKKI